MGHKLWWLGLPVCLKLATPVKVPPTSHTRLLPPEPRREFSCVELQGVERTETKTDHGKRVQHPGSKGVDLQQIGDFEEVRETSSASALNDPILDDRGRRIFSNRVQDIDQELNAAKANTDVAHRDALLEERRQLLEKLKAAKTLAGRPRQFADDEERARIAVSNAISRAIRQIQKHLPKCSEHLQASIRTGGLCRYVDDGNPWKV